MYTPENMPAYPIDKPGYSSPKIILERLAKVSAEMPQYMHDILFTNSPLPDTITVSDETFITNARLLNRIYEAASRWILQEPYLDEYSSYAQSDIRGYYHLNKVDNLTSQLNSWHQLDKSTQETYSGWLIGECMNTLNDYTECQSTLEYAITSGTVSGYHDKYSPRSKQIYDSFFQIDTTRPEAIWNSSDINVMKFPFTRPDRKDVRDWFKKNIEDEWHVNDWHLTINYSNVSGLAQVVFESGATPNVSGDTITMDANEPINEYAADWTIRHEFGHVLGFPDCYVEFYDKTNRVMINYQIDVDNLMCSRRGHLKTTHFNELKKHYYRG